MLCDAKLASSAFLSATWKRRRKPDVSLDQPSTRFMDCGWFGFGIEVSVASKERLRCSLCGRQDACQVGARHSLEASRCADLHPTTFLAMPVTQQHVKNFSEVAALTD